MYSKATTLLALLFSLTISSALSADVSLPAIFGDQMVLQQKQSNPVWGWADAYWRSFGDEVYFNLGEDGVPGTGIYTPASGDDSIAEESDRVQRYIDNETAFEGLGDQGSRGESANVFTSYRFTEGALEGFNIGGGIRY